MEYHPTYHKWVYKLYTVGIPIYIVAIEINTKITSLTAEVAAENGSARFNYYKCTYPALTVRAIAESLNTVLDSTSNSTYSEGTAKVV